jgi:hypothetical protein
MSEYPDGFIAASILWTVSSDGRAAIMAEPVTDHLVVHPRIDHVEDDETGDVTGYRFSGTWTVTHQPSGLTVCPFESLPTIEAAREWARVVENFPGLDLDAEQRETAIAGADATALWSTWSDFRNKAWEEFLANPTGVPR